MKLINLPGELSGKPAFSPSNTASRTEQSAIKLAQPERRPPDKITFGMKVNAKAGCCAEKVRTGRTGGCCSHIPQAEFVEHYRKSVQELGFKPDPEVQAVLDKPVSKSKPVAKPESTVQPSPVEQDEKDKNDKKTKKLISQPKSPIIRWLLAPFRFLKWLLLGFWEDLKLLVRFKD